MADFHEFYLGHDIVPSMRISPGLHFRITRRALEKLQGPLGALSLGDAYRLHQSKIDERARAMVEANPDMPRPLVLDIEHV